MFSLLNLLSGFLETGVVIFALRNFGIKTALFLALLYQLGNLSPYPFRISKQLATMFACISATLMFWCIYFPFLGLTAVPFLSLALQSVRSDMKTESSKMLKRSFRTLGFLLGFGFNALLGFLCAVVVLVVLIHIKEKSLNKVFLPKFRKLQAIMILHQMHYFVYCYSAMIIAYKLGGALLAAGIFFAGWLTYIFAPFLYRKGKDYRKMFLFGHSLLTLLLLSMFFAPTILSRAIFWLLTGIGGTTEFCIGKLEHELGHYSEINHNCSENFGHILGVTTCFLSFVLFSNINLSILLAAGFALTALILMSTLKIGV